MDACTSNQNSNFRSLSQTSGSRNKPKESPVCRTVDSDLVGRNKTETCSVSHTHMMVTSYFYFQMGYNLCDI